MLHSSALHTSDIKLNIWKVPYVSVVNKWKVSVDAVTFGICGLWK